MPFLLTSSLHLCHFPLFRGLLPSCRGWVLRQDIMGWAGVTAACLGFLEG